jgi:hypothetical protein
MLGQKYSYLSVIDALIYLANNTRPDITFALNCLIRHNMTHVMHH